MSNAIAFFDFDGTLTQSDSLLPFLRAVRGQKRFWLDMLAVSPWLAMYALKILPNHKAKERLLRQALLGMDKAELYAKGAAFADTLSGGQLNALMLEKLKCHQEAGHITVLVSASLDVYLEYWSELFGFDYCLCSKLNCSDDGVVSGALEGGNCFGHEKVRRIKELLREKPHSMKTFAYGDSVGDMPMLELVDEGYLYKKGRLALIR
ncbi:HAD-IB family hydrolase [Marinomonas fungiae]|uniref:HAD-IB family hydrolase n=1 Tax=Marinomonas fungiae TaxID=1137284 RepID=UPI003A93355A